MSIGIIIHPLRWTIIKMPTTKSPYGANVRFSWSIDQQNFWLITVFRVLQVFSFESFLVGFLVMAKCGLNSSDGQVTTTKY